MVAPLGRSKANDAQSPMSELSMPSMIDITVILKNVVATNLAVAAGITRNAAINIIPTNLTEITTVTAIRIDKI